MFSLIAVVPAILVAIFAAVTLNLGVEAWFSERVKTALGSAVNVAQHYVQEHERGITLDAAKSPKASSTIPDCSTSRAMCASARCSRSSRS